MKRKSLCLIAGLAVSLSAWTAEGTVLIDFGASATTTTTETLTGPTRTWNNITDTGAVTALALISTDTTPSGYSIQISNTATSGTNVGRGFDASNTNGITTTAGNAAARGYPSSATRDSLFGYTQSASTFTNPTGNVILTVSGLTAGEKYNFFGFASRSATDNREQSLLFQGAGAPVDVIYNAAGNPGTTFGSGDIVANGSGIITVTISPTANSATANDFFYLGVLEINAVPEPTGLSLLAIGGFVLCRRRRK